MNHSLEIAFLAGLGGMFGWGFADFFAKTTVDKIGELKSLVWAHFFGTSLFILVAVLQFAISGHLITFPHHLVEWAGLVFFGALQMLVYWLVYMAFNKGQLAIVNPIFASYSGIVALVSIVALGEKPSALVVAALLLIFAGILLLNLDFKGLSSKKLKVVPGLKEAIAGAALAAIWTLSWNRFVSGRNPLSWALFMYLFMTLTATLAALAKQVKLPQVPKKLWRPLILIGAGETLAYLSISYGFGKTSHTSIVALVSGAFSLPTLLLAYFFLGERLTKSQTLAIAITIIGIVLVSVG